MPYSDDELLAYLATPEKTEKKKKPKQAYSDEELLSYLPQASETTPGTDPILEHAREVIAPSIAPTIRGGALAGGAGLMSLVARGAGLVRPGKGWDEEADWWANYSRALVQATGEQQSSIIQRGATGALASAPPMLVTAPAGPWGMIGGGIAAEMNAATAEGRKAGLKGAELAAYVGRQGAIEGTISGAMQKVGLGGLERVVGSKAAIRNGIRQTLKKQAKTGLKSGAKALGRTFLEEEVEEVTISVLQQLNERYSGTDSSELSLDSLAKTAAETTAVVAWTVLGGAGPVTVSNQLTAGKEANTQQEIVKAAEAGQTPSRRQWREWGLGNISPEFQSFGKSATGRTEGLRIAAEAIRQSEQQVSPETSEAATEAPMAPGEIPYVQETTEGIPTPEEAVTEQVTQPVVETPLTGLKNELVNQFRQKRGDPLLPEATPESFKEWLDKGEARIIEDTTAPQRLVTDLLKTPRVVSSAEHAMLTLYYAQQKQHFNQTTDELFEAEQANDQGAVERAQAKSDALLEEIRNTEKASNLAGTESGRSFVARKIVLDQDFSLGTLVKRARVAKGGQQLSGKEPQQIKELAAKVAQLETELAERADQGALDRAISDAKRKKSFLKQQKTDAQKQVDLAWEELNAAITGKPSVKKFISEERGALNPRALVAAAKLARAYINLGMATFTEFHATMKHKLGAIADSARADLREIWNKVTAEVGLPALEVDVNNPRAMTRQSTRIIRSLVEAGITDRNAILDAVHAEFAAVNPEITKDQVREIISGYGQYRELTRDDIQTKVNDIKGQLRQEAKLRDIEQGAKPKRTGFLKQAPSETEQALRAEVQAAMRAAGFLPSQTMTEEQRTAAYRKHLEKQLADYERRIAEGDFSKREVHKTRLDPETLKLRGKVHAAKQKFAVMEGELRRQRMTTAEKIKDMAKEAIYLHRAFRTAFDFSAVLRQGGVVSLGHPVLATKIFPDMFASFISEESAYAAMEEIQNRPNAWRYNLAKLAVTGFGEMTTHQEEVFRGRWASKIPGVAASERAYVVFLNRMRADLFDYMTSTVGATPTTTLEEDKTIANYINVATGRGNFGAYAAGSDLAAMVFFSPRYVLSRFQYLAGTAMWGGTAKTRKLVAAEYARALRGIGSVLLLAGLYGQFSDDEEPLTIDFNPLSSDFGKVRIGNKRYDFLAGLSQTATFVARTISGYTKKATGETVPIRGENVPYLGDTTPAVMGRFLRTKFSPVLGTIVDILAGENVIGEKVTPLTVARDIATPLSLNDVYEALKDQGLGKEAALALVVIFGLGVQNYEGGGKPEHFAEKISSGRLLKKRDKETGEIIDRTDTVRAIVQQAKRLGISPQEMSEALALKLRKKGYKSEAISNWQRRFYSRYNRFKSK